MTETLEHTARKIAERGRDALVARLRPAFEQAAATHGEGLDLDDEQLEQMVQRAADRADGLQWRRALAQVATEQLGIGLGEALSHPAVARAQAIVGAPSYEEALGELASERPAAVEKAAGTDPEPKNGAEPRGAEPDEPQLDEDVAADAPEDDGPDATAEHEAAPAAAQPEPGEADQEDDEPEPGEEPVIPEPAPAPAADAEPAEDPEPARDPNAATDSEAAGGAVGEAAGDSEPAAVRLRAVHLGGIANLAPAEGDLELHLSEAGLDIVRGPERSPLGRLTWDEIVALETPPVGGRFRRKKQADAHLVIRSAQGSASFEVPGVTSDELSEHITPMLARHRK